VPEVYTAWVSMVGLLFLAWPVWAADGAAKELADLERLTWRELVAGGYQRRYNHCPASEMSRLAQDRPMELKLDDFETLFSIRIDQKKRLWGLLHDGIFRLLWWDPDHQVYPMNLKDN